jgi:hypothetical protein
VLPLDIEGRQAFGSADLAIAATAFTYELVLLNRIVPHFKFQVVKVVDPFNDQPDSLLELLPCPCGPSRSFPQTSSPPVAWSVGPESIRPFQVYPARRAAETPSPASHGLFSIFRDSRRNRSRR